MRIEDYALIGDLKTAALVGRNGSIDWLCWPHFASEACFAKLLGTEDNGFWKIAPAGEVTRSTRRYEDHTLILETTFETEKGEVQLVDFMPPRHEHSRIVRIVKGIAGEVAMRSELAIRFSYGRAVPWVTRTENGIRAVAGPDTIELRTTAPLEGRHLRTNSEFTVRAGQSVSFTLIYGDYGDYSENGNFPLRNVDDLYNLTKRFWCDWVSKMDYEGEYRQYVERSLITLKALIFAPTGGIVAAPTTSLPEDIGGIRNWDYRYCWLRDTTFTLLALINGGYYDEARAWMHWLHRTIAGSPDQVQIMYGVSGQRTLVEWELAKLKGYENSKPVRIGNAASQQLQLDIYGEVLDAFYWSSDCLGEEAADIFPLIITLIDHLETVWQLPDQGIWETRSGPKHFTYSKVMSWVAFDRAIKITQKDRLSAPLERWQKTRSEIHKQVCEKAFSAQLNSFVQYYGSDELDASLLLMAMVGFLPHSDSRIRGTIEAIERHLMRDGLVIRYDPMRTDDGLKGNEGKFLACSFWLASDLQMVGREDDARKLFERLLTLTNDVGLLSEEYDTKRKRFCGNFPQALSHIALIGAASQLTQLKHTARHKAGMSI
ncbi:MAG TPA: glycoside hydrolase family 15 protein [Candidatus Acidoferrales bacterium]|nr:glycoside hydrolase family 15 protein [Candidatus Acidoferrales bacterium]